MMMFIDDVCVTTFGTSFIGTNKRRKRSKKKEKKQAEELKFVMISRRMKIYSVKLISELTQF